MTKLRQATFAERRDWADNPREIYPLWGYARLACGAWCPVEDLRGSWSRPDPVWEVHAPDGFHFADDYTHTLLCYSQADLRDRLAGVTLEPCHEGCRDL